MATRDVRDLQQDPARSQVVAAAAGGAAAVSAAWVRGCIEARQLLDKGPRLVLVKHLAHAGLDPDRSFEMLLVSRSSAWHVATPLLPFSRPPVGVGDLTSGLFLANLLHGKTPPEALEHTASAYFAVMQAPCVA